MILIGCTAGTILKNPESITYQKVYEVNLTKKEIHNKSLEWMARNYGSSKEVIELADEEYGKIIGKGIVSLNLGIGMKVPVKYTDLTPKNWTN